MEAGHRWRGDVGFIACAIFAWAIAERLGVVDEGIVLNADALAGVFGTLFGLGAAAYVFAVMLPNADFAAHLAKERLACQCHSALDNLRFVFQWQVLSAIAGLLVALAILVFQAPSSIQREAAFAARGALCVSMAVAVKICYDLVVTLTQLGRVWEKWLVRSRPPSSVPEGKP